MGIAYDITRETSTFQNRIESESRPMSREWIAWNDGRGQNIDFARLSMWILILEVNKWTVKCADTCQKWPFTKCVIKLVADVKSLLTLQYIILTHETLATFLHTVNITLSIKIYRLSNWD